MASPTWQEEALLELGRRAVCGYRRQARPQIEPTAFVAMALSDYGLNKPAGQACDWLARKQRADGRISVGGAEDDPSWGTALAILAWTQNANYRSAVKRAIDYVLSVKGTTSENPEKLVDHDTTIVGWPWVQGTHSWVEPTALNILALQAVGVGDHPRAIDGRRLLTDRLLPTGGCNYGNTIVLGRLIRPHVQPTGLALLALANQPDGDGRIRASLNYLERFLSGSLATASASYAMLALAAHHRAVDLRRLDEPVRDTLRQGARPLQLALALIASKGNDSILVRASRGPAA